MKAIYLTRTYLKKPLHSIGILLCVTLIMESLAWTVAYQLKLEVLVRNGGLWNYISLILRGFILPELCTAVILTALLNQQHIYFKVNSVGLTLRDIGRYELAFLPVILVSFFVFNPATQTIRFLLSLPPHYTFYTYWNSYILGTFTVSFYFRYLIAVIIIGYTLINISLVSDYIKQRREAQAEIENQAVMAIQAAQAAMASQTTPVSSPNPAYLSHLKGKNAHGELDFPVEEVYFFTIEDRYYYAQLAKGQYLVGKTLNELETDLDPTLFFRIKRDYIVNRQAILNYAYWENGKYIVRLNTPDRHEIVVPRARMQEFREWLQANQRPYADTSDSFVLAS